MRLIVEKIIKFRLKWDVTGIEHGMSGREQ